MQGRISRCWAGLLGGQGVKLSSRGYSRYFDRELEWSILQLVITRRAGRVAKQRRKGGGTGTRRASSPASRSSSGSSGSSDAPTMMWSSSSQQAEASSARQQAQTLCCTIGCAYDSATHEVMSFLHACVGHLTNAGSRQAHRGVARACAVATSAPARPPRSNLASDRAAVAAAPWDS